MSNLFKEVKYVNHSDRNNLRNHKGCTLWFTGLSASGKTTTSFAVEETLCKQGVNVYTIDGDNTRMGLNKNLGFSEQDRAENIRRVGEVAKLFTDSGTITLTSFISPYRKDRDNVRKIHEESFLPFYEIYMKTPLEVCEKRDPKGLYKKAREGFIKNFTGIDDPYEEPENPDLVIDNSLYTKNECVELVIKFLQEKGILMREEPKELFMTESEKQIWTLKTSECISIEISEVDLQWVQVLSEGWATPLTGFMREKEYLESLHFNYITKDDYKYNQSVPIVLPITTEDKKRIKSNSSIILTYKNKNIAVLSYIEIYEHRKEERCCRTWGTCHPEHPHINLINQTGEYLVGGDLKVFERIKWEDGLDQYRLTPKELKNIYKEKGADAVVAFQLRNPIHNGHALLMQDTMEKMNKKGYKRPLLLLHPLGGWTKDDDAPLDVRMEQYKVIIEENVLDKDSTILAIFPSPMLYAGPTEVQWHAKSRKNAGANFYIVGRDPAGMSHPNGGDLYDAWHGKTVLERAPYLNINIVPFHLAAYDKTVKKMVFFDPSRSEDFEFISGTKMRTLAREGRPLPDGFMNDKAWKVLSDFYNM